MIITPKIIKIGNGYYINIQKSKMKEGEFQLHDEIIAHIQKNKK